MVFLPVNVSTHGWTLLQHRSLSHLASAADEKCGLSELEAKQQVWQRAKTGHKKSREGTEGWVELGARAPPQDTREKADPYIQRLTQ